MTEKAFIAVDMVLSFLQFQQDTGMQFCLQPAILWHVLRVIQFAACAFHCLHLAPSQTCLNISHSHATDARTERARLQQPVNNILSLSRRCDDARITSYAPRAAINDAAH